MKGSLRVITLANIPVYIHWSFSLILIYILYIAQNEGLGWNTVLFITTVFLSVFICVVLHEFGHALTARRYGVETKDIILLPIGGIARLSRLPEKPIHEFWVAIAGPLVNVFIAFILCGYFLFVSPGDLFPYDENFTTARQWFYFVPFLLGLNLMLALFNLIPAFPLDGGRIFRALLSIKLGRTKATRVASFLGQIMAILFLTYGLYSGDFIIGLIGIFVYFTASREYSVVKMEGLLDDYTVSEIIRTQFTILPSVTTMQEAVQLLKRGLEKWFLVEKEGQIIGMITEENLLKTANNETRNQIVENYMTTTFDKLSPDDSLKKVYQLIQSKGVENFLVYDESGILVGVVDMEGIQFFLKIIKNKK